MPDQAELHNTLLVMTRSLQGIRIGSDGWVDVANIASATIPGVDGAGIAAAQADGTWETRSCRWSLAEEGVRIQFDLGEGPCLDALDEGSVVVADDLAEDERWSIYSPKVAGMGIRSQLAIEMSGAQDRRIVLCLSAQAPGAFEPAVVQVAQIFASHASVALGCLSAAETMSNAISTRGTIGQAIGLVMERYQLNDAQAFQYLRRLSQTQNIKLRTIAEDVVTDANQQSALAG